MSEIQIQTERLIKMPPVNSKGKRILKYLDYVNLRN
jgi:hypothetical protein